MHETCVPALFADTQLLCITVTTVIIYFAASGALKILDNSSKSAWEGVLDRLLALPRKRMGRAAG